ncbi:MAG: hypothetical protein ACFB0G_01040 [Leptolyngbyaceae cyanobacterium]
MTTATQEPITHPIPTAAFHEARIKAMLKRLVIQLGYLQQQVESGVSDPSVSYASLAIDTSIDALTDHLERLQ